MLAGKINKHAKIVWEWYLHERNNKYPSDKVMKALRWYVKHYPIPEYTYEGDWKSHMEYACDRMNGGRAKAILRLIREAKNKEA